MFGTQTAVLVADISGSTALYEAVGNETAFNQIAGCLDALRQITECHGGHFIHSKGDDVLCTFEDAEQSFVAASEILNLSLGSALSVHCGLDFGEILHARGDVFGDCVNTTARLAGYANPGEALCSQAYYAQLGQSQKTRLRYLETWRFKGKAEGAAVYSFQAEGLDSVTHYSTPSIVPFADRKDAVNGAGMTLNLVYQKNAYACSGKTDFYLGRASECDLVVPRLWVSRLHASLEIRGDKAYLRDTSTNGTYVCFPGQTPVLARREAVLLPEKCAFSLTKEPSEPEAELISCTIHRPAGGDQLSAQSINSA